MEFKREAEMAEPVEDWLNHLGLMTKAEVPNAWGICDLIGCSLDQERALERIQLGQRSPIGPRFRIDLLARIPDRETGRAVTLGKLQRRYSGFVDDDAVEKELARLVAGRFVEVTPRGTYQKLNGWHPLHARLVTVELKLSRVREALDQAIANQDLTIESYVALPATIASRTSRDRFHEAGVGILGVTRSGVEVLLSPRPTERRPDVVAQSHCVERFWRLYTKGS